MKNVYISDIHQMSLGDNITLYGWISGRRKSKKILFLDIADSTGSIQVVIEKSIVGEAIFEQYCSATLESSVIVRGVIQHGRNNDNEILVKKLEIIEEATLQLSPLPRSDFDVFDPKHTEQLLKYRHIYLRNPKIMAIIRFRSKLMSIVRDWFHKNKFMEFDAPILTPTPLYDGSTALSINVHGEDVFLSQCAGFYLEAAAHAFERIYNMGPSFRGEESRSKRHLMEYWHIKAEMTFGDREDIIALVEDILGYIVQQCQAQCQDVFDILGTQLCVDGIKSPFPRITHEDAVIYLKKKGFDADFDQGVSTAEEVELSKLYDSPFWLVGIPRTVEPFPYAIDPNDSRITMVADLIASNGCGELLGVAEKIYRPAMLDERLEEKGKLTEPRYQFVRDVHQAGCVPHIAFGMGLERLIRWLLNIPHVRDTIPFPRVVRRNIYP